jgi:hypothetical protein
MAVAAGAVAGAWIFAGRTILAIAQERSTLQAASVQEQFDFYVFEMPDTTMRSTLPSYEQIATVAGPDDRIRKTAESERLVDWYEINSDNPGVATVAISQRANASYTDGLLRTTAIVWSAVTAAWCAVLIVVSLLAGLTLGTFLLGVLLPVLPAFLDVVQYVVRVWRSAADRADLARSIERKLSGDLRPEPQELMVWQERLFELRRAAPVVPDAIYKLKRKTSERAMRSAVDQLSRRVQEGN